MNHFKIKPERFLLIGLLLFSVAIASSRDQEVPEKKGGTSYQFISKRLGIPILRSTIKIEEGLVEQGKPIVQVKARVTSLNTGFFFRMDNQFVSVIDQQTFTPIRYFKAIDQNGLFIHRKEYSETVTFDLANQKLIIEPKGENKKRQIPLPPNTYDPLSMFARYMLKEDLRPGKDIQISVYDGVRVREMVFRSKKEMVKSKLFGDVEAVCLESTTSFSSFGDKEGMIRIWYKTDHQRIPISMELDLPVGTVRFELESIEKT